AELRGLKDDAFLYVIRNLGRFLPLAADELHRRNTDRDRYLVARGPQAHGLDEGEILDGAGLARPLPDRDTDEIPARVIRSALRRDPVDDVVVFFVCARQPLQLSPAQRNLVLEITVVRIDGRVGVQVLRIRPTGHAPSGSVGI